MTSTIIVTGAAGGIGSEICRGLARDGLQVVVADFNLDAAGSLANRIGKEQGTAVAVEVDVGDKVSVNRMVETTLSRFGQIDYLLNGAGIISRVPVVDMPEEDWDRVLRINLKGVFLCSQAVARHMVKKKKGASSTSPRDGV